MFGAHYRTGGAGMAVILLVCMELVSFIAYFLIRNSPEEAPYALMGFVFTAGVWLTVSGIIAILSDKDREELLSSTVVILVSMCVVLVSLAALLDSPAVPSGIRSSSWTFLGIFCFLATLIAQLVHADIGNNANMPWPVRWVFAASFLYPPLHLHFGVPRSALVLVLLLQVVSGLWLFFRWWKNKSPVVNGAASASA